MSDKIQSADQLKDFLSPPDLRTPEELAVWLETWDSLTGNKAAAMLRSQAAEIERLTQAVDCFIEAKRQSDAEIAALKEDKDRLQWAIDNAEFTDISAIFLKDDVREAIDAARKDGRA